MTDHAETRARLHSSSDWGTWGSAFDHHRYAKAAPRKPGGQFKCHCGCEGRATHWGMANGVTLTSGCEMYVRRWVRDPRTGDAS